MEGGDALRTSPAEEAGVEAMEDSTDTLTRSVLVQMAALGHDKAKELTSSPPSSDRETAQVLSWLASLCQAEKLYFSLHFLNSRTSIFRKEVCKFKQVVTKINTRNTVHCA